jgi:hypothetical protein
MHAGNLDAAEIAFLPANARALVPFHSGVGILACKCTGLEAYSTLREKNFGGANCRGRASERGTSRV